jgi:hypothetical protein
MSGGGRVVFVEAGHVPNPDDKAHVVVVIPDSGIDPESDWPHTCHPPETVRVGMRVRSKDRPQTVEGTVVARSDEDTSYPWRVFWDDGTEEHCRHGDLRRTARKIAFLVTCMEDQDRILSQRVARTRCWGWYSEHERAETAVLGNYTDMFEANYYDVAVIEEVQEGIIARCMRRWWYRANYKSPSSPPVVEKIEEPEWAKNVTGYGIG